MLAALTQSLQAVDLALLTTGVVLLAGIAVKIRRDRAAMLRELPATTTTLTAVDGLVILMGYVAMQFAVATTLSMFWPREELLKVGSAAWYAFELVDISTRLLLIVVIACILHRMQQRAPATSSPGAVRGTVLALCAFLVLLPLVLIQLKCAMLVWQWLSDGTPPPQHPVLLAIQGETSSPLGLALLVFGAVVVAPIGEELVFRGALLDSLHRQTGLAWYAIVASAVLFGMVHLAQPQTIVPLTTMGVVLGYLRARTRRLWPCILAHALFNARTMTLAILAPELIDRA